jgi:two-component system cell cycle response regulator CtrA
MVEANENLKFRGVNTRFSNLVIRKGATLSKRFSESFIWRHGRTHLKLLMFCLQATQKLADALDNQNYIETIWGRGYVLRGPPRKKTNKGLLLQQKIM